ncbi:solute carrier family 52, riboflavin transporter, member 3-B-like [Bufo gargarizans]|uniref:solute carrier family 52, riboflavin transporter, member 3-B-like n=1 Tax=Bufo gargarizans TaxID=30331 RepID=UPI001CF2ADB9|nr:solute carrier family 52, riboflavin transporter, member 3-B-like [Bufo gargarizans]XP_044151098.1 solute carrier family 52, riboflavin transporter, member 3-B-like [Bufo gargarizans]
MAVILHILSCLLGLGSWVAINGVWVELPLLVPYTPEGWELPAYLSLLIQFANIGPLTVTLTHKFCPGSLREGLVIFVILVVGVVSCILLAFLWQETSWVGSSRRSTALLCLLFFISLVDCTSSVTFLPYMTRLRPNYLISYFIGEGLSGLMPALLALAQGVGVMSCQPINGTEPNGSYAIGNLTAVYQPARFPTWGFFLFLAGMMGLCLIAFIILHKMPKEQGHQEAGISKRRKKESWNRGVEQKPMMGEDETGKEDAKKEVVKYSMWEKVFIYLVLAWVNALTNAVLPSVQTYSCMPYGGRVYHLSATLASIANPAACGIAMYLPTRCLLTVSVLTVIGSGIGSYIMGMAVLSPCPPLLMDNIGGILIVVAWILFVGVLSYVKVILGVILRSEGHSALVWCGAMVQLGSMLGALTMFPLVNVYTMFQSGDPCNQRCPQ